jgi:hypothetical protein
MSLDTILRKKYFKNLEKCSTEQLSVINEIVSTKGALQGLVDNKEMLLNALR